MLSVPGAAADGIQDGGGVRGLSTIIILKHLMKAISRRRKRNVEPWEEFDMIGGTSTGGLIAIMLGRLRMSLRDCEKAYLRLSERIFNPKRHSANVLGKTKDFLMANGRFDSQALEQAVKEVMVDIAKVSDETLLQDLESRCKVFVSATRVSNSSLAVLRSYESDLPETLYDECRIWEACRATSAAPTFFDPVKIGPYGQQFVDGGILYNNPIDLLHREANATWPNDISGAVFISIGTGSAPSGAFEGNLKSIIEAMKEIVTQTERTAEDFANSHPELLLTQRLFRFQVFHGLEGVGLEEYKEAAKMADATQSYLDLAATRGRMNECVERFCGNTVVTAPGKVIPLTKDQQGCLKSLSFPDMEKRQNDIAAAVDDTCTWLDTQPVYAHWLESKCELLWIKGKPGAGKSTLMKYALQKIQRHPDRREVLTVSFFFNARGSPLEKSLPGLYRSLLHQLLPSMPDQLSELTLFYKSQRQTRKQWSWHEAELQSLLTKFLLEAAKVHPIRIFVDALDECGEKKAVELVGYFENLISKLQTSTATISICFSCRHYPILTIYQGLAICVEDQNHKDISTYIRKKFAAGHLDPGKTVVLAEELIERANGVFQWIVLVVPNILHMNRRTFSLQKIQDEIKKIPRELSGLYKEIVEQMVRESQSESLQLMQWVCFALRPLSLRALRFAMAFDADTPYKSLSAWVKGRDFIETDEQMETRVKDLSKGLAEVKRIAEVKLRRRGTVVQFIHESVNDFLIREGGLALLDNCTIGTAIGRAHFRLSRTCIWYLGLEEIGHWDGVIEKLTHTGPFLMDDKDQNLAAKLEHAFPFLEYATTCWVPHAVEVETEQGHQEDLSRLFSGKFGNLIMQRWINSYRYIRPYSHDGPKPGTTLRHILSRHGLTSALSAALDRDNVNVDSKDGEDSTPLHLAAEEGHEAVVRLLLEKGADVNAKNGDEEETALLEAAGNGHMAVVRLLLNHGADVTAKDRDKETALLEAATYGQEAVVRLLLEMGADVTAKDGQRRTALHLAAEDGHVAVVQLLLENGADVTAKEVLEPTDVVRLQLVSRHFLSLARDNNLWKTLCFHDSRAEAARRRQQFVASQEPGLAALVQAMVALPRGSDAFHDQSAPTAEMQVRQDATKERVRALANWDPSYPGENFNFYQEYIQRHASITESWFQTFQDGTGEEKELREATGIGVLYDYNDNIADKVVAPLDDGSVCVWNMFSDTGDDKSSLPGRVMSRSSTGLLTGKGPDIEWDKRLAQSKAMMTETGAVECVSIDSRQRRGYFAVQNYLNEVDLNTLQVIHREQYPFPITALSDGGHLTPLTVGTNFTLHLHDPRSRSNFSNYDSSMRCELIGGTPPKNYFSHTQTGDRRRHSTLSQPGPLSILHLPERSQDDNGAIWVAGRFTSLLHYDRRFFPRLRGTLHSGARLSCLTSLTHPFIPREMDLLRNPSLPIAALRAAKSMPGTTLLAAGEYKGKGSLELYGLQSSSPSSTHDTTHATPSMDPRKTTPFYHNRQTASASKLLSVAPHGTRLVYSDADGFLRWVERDGVTPVRRHNINHDPDVLTNHHVTHHPNGSGPTHPATTTGNPFSTPIPTSQQSGEGGDIVQKLIPTPHHSTTGEQSNTNHSLHHDDLLIWTGDGRLGLVGFGRTPAFAPEELEEQARSAEEAERMRRERTYGWAMRRALERQADEVRFVRGLGMGMGYGG